MATTMGCMDDWSLLKAYIDHDDETAFAALVKRHIGLVYGAALRQLNDNQVAAEEVVQVVFTSLARNGSKLRSGSSLAAWLYRAAVGKAIDHIRQNSARRRREQKHALAMKIDQPEHAVEWETIAPLLESAMDTLSEVDRTAILMRVFEERPLAEVGAALGVSADTARKRVAAALEQLRRWFERRGVRCTSGALGITLGSFAVVTPAEGLLSATVDGALTAASLSSTITSTTLLLTTMQTMKLSIPLGLLAGAALPLSLGYLASEQPLGKTSEPPSSLILASPEISLPSAQMSELMAEWERMRSEHGPDTGSMPALYEIVAAIDEDFKRRTFRAILLAEWAEIDPQGALRYFGSAERQDHERVAQILALWLKRDSETAIEAMKASSSETVHHRIGGMLDLVAEVAPARLRELASMVDSKNDWDTRVRDAFAVAARNDLASALESAQGVEGAVRGEALAGIALAWAEEDADAALAWVTALEPSEDRAEALRNLLVGWAKSDPVAALDRLDLAPPGGGHRAIFNTETAEHVLRAASQTDFNATLDWLADNPDAITSKGYHGLTDALRGRLADDVPGTLTLMQEHPASATLVQALRSELLNGSSERQEEVWEWAASQPASAFISRVKQEVFGAASWHRPDKAVEWISAFVESSSNSEQAISYVVSSLVDSSAKHHRMEGLLEELSGPVREELLRVAFRNVTYEDAHVWMPRLAELPLADRNQAVRSLAAAQAAADPVAAISWAEGYSDHERASAYEGIAESWAAADGMEASQWIASLPEGMSRDHATRALVETVARAEPDSAWAWAKMVADPQQREASFHAALRHMGSNARATVTQSEIAEPEKLALLEWVEKNLNEQ